MHVTSPALRGFSASEELFAVLLDPAGDLDRKDGILLSLLLEHRRPQRAGALRILTTALFPALDQIFASRAAKILSGEQDELWSCINSAFTEAVDRYPTSRRPRRVAANLRGETLAGLRRGRESEIAIERIRCVEKEILTLLPAESAAHLDAMPLGIFDFRDDPVLEPREVAAQDLEDAERSLDRFVVSGLIDSEDRLLLLGIYLHEETLAKIAVRLGIGREAAKKRLQRAVMRIRRGSGAVHAFRRTARSQSAGGAALVAKPPASRSVGADSVPQFGDASFPRASPIRPAMTFLSGEQFGAPRRERPEAS